MYFPCGAVVRNPPANVGDMGLSGRSSGVRNGNPLQYSYLENSMGRGVWWAACSPWLAELDMSERLSMYTGTLYTLTYVSDFN